MLLDGSIVHRVDDTVRTMPLPSLFKEVQVNRIPKPFTLLVIAFPFSVAFSVSLIAQAEGERRMYLGYHSRPPEMQAATIQKVEAKYGMFDTKRSVASQLYSHTHPWHAWINKVSACIMLPLSIVLLLYFVAGPLEPKSRR